MDTPSLKRLLRTDELPTLPEVVGKILEVSRNDRSTVHDLAVVIEYDPALSANLLRLVNSAYYGCTRRVVAVLDAVLLLGYDTIRALALGTSVLTSLPVSPGFQPRRFRAHSMGCAVVARAIAERFGHPQAEQALAAGLLHDMGALLLAVRLPDKPYGGGEGMTPAEEIEIFGFTHPEAGGRLARHWNFETDLVAAIQGHHLTEAPLSTQHPLARLVFLAEWLTRDQFQFDGKPIITSHEPAAVAASLGYDLGELEELTRGLPALDPASYEKG
ncbi:MAG: HDOD domain-containing protein [Nitrospirota bacterium]|nr:HDOD domain-containing protein [Nitrospirota bacterium]